MYFYSNLHSWNETKISNLKQSDFKYPMDFGKCHIPADLDSESVTSLENNEHENNNNSCQQLLLKNLLADSVQAEISKIIDIHQVT